MTILDLLHISKPFPNSDFTENQIDRIFEVWKIFTQSDSKETNVKKKWHILSPKYMPVDNTWVMNTNNPTTFCKYLRSYTNLMDDLSMSFQPTINHFGDLEPGNISDVVRRYTHWLPFIHVINIDQEIEESQNNLNCVIQEMREIHVWFQEVHAQKKVFYEKLSTRMVDISGKLSQHFNKKMENIDMYLRKMEKEYAS